MVKVGDKVRSKELPCLGIGKAIFVEENPHNERCRIVTVTWPQDPHEHLSPDHSPTEDWDIIDLEVVV